VPGECRKIGSTARIELIRPDFQSGASNEVFPLGDLTNALPRAFEQETAMQLSDLTMLTFTACNSLRVFAYVPQIVSAIRDNTGCRGVSYGTWCMFLIAHASAVAYALVNVKDSNMAFIFAGNGICCLAILVVVVSKRRRHAVLTPTVH
jgi:hypothetical protein